ncbi:MAG: M16 family metallopeptidase [Ignavibacteriaceae bacterium]
MDLLNVNYEKYKLQNGLEVILYRDNALPIVTANIWYRAGSANEKAGKTGIAHLFEHMMFQGSVNVPKEMHFRFIQEAGGNLNGSTSTDRTNYFEKVPSNFLELILWLESDRMGFFIPALTQEKLANQIDVVKNERLERYDNQPYGLAWEILISNLFPKNHPYSWATIGSLKDITNFTIEDVKSFFEKYYSPANASLVIAGDFDPDEAKELTEKYFSEIPGRNHFEELQIKPATLAENKFIVHKDKVQLARIYLAWHTECAYSEDDAALDILTDLLTGSKTSRLYKKLVFEQEVAQEVTAYQFSGKFAGYFVVIATAKPGILLTELKEKIFAEFENIKKNGINEKELLRSKNGIKSGFIYSMQNIDSMADQLNSYNYFLNEPNSFNYDLSRYENVSVENLLVLFDKYLSKPFVELHVIPETEG